jgi:hypothetical protein
MIGKLLSGHDLRRLAVTAECCEETARRFLLGQPVRTTSRVRLERAAASLGVIPAPPAPLGAGDFDAVRGMRA